MANEEWRTGTVGSYDPVTKERVTNTFTYQPAPPPSPMDILGKIAGEAYSTLPLEDAEKATAAAIQFQGMRGYQQALKNGDPASKALAQWGPLMFYQKPQTIAPMIKATTPAAMTPYQQGMLDIAKQKFDLQRTAPALTPAVVQELEYGGQKIPILGRPGSTRFERLDKPGVEESFDRMDYQRALADRSKAMEALAGGMLDPTGMQQASNNLAQAEARIQQLRAPKAKTVSGPSKTAEGKPATVKAGDLYKGYRFKGGDPAKKENWEKAT